jgi:hypothetical protein
VSYLDSRVASTGGGLRCRASVGCDRAFHPVVAPHFLPSGKLRDQFDVLALRDAASRRDDHETVAHQYHHSQVRAEKLAPFNGPDTDGYMPRRKAVPA